MINNKTSKTTANISLASSFGLATPSTPLTDERGRPLVASDGSAYVYGDTTFVWIIVEPDKSNNNKKSKKHSIYDDIKDYIADPHSGTTIVFFTDGTEEVAKADEFDRDNYDVGMGILLCVARHLGFGYDDLEKTIYHKDGEQNAENERRKKEEEKETIRRKREKNAKRKAKRRNPIVLNNFVAHCDHDDDVAVETSKDNSSDTDKHKLFKVGDKVKIVATEEVWGFTTSLYEKGYQTGDIVEVVSGPYYLVRTEHDKLLHNDGWMFCVDDLAPVK